MNTATRYLLTGIVGIVMLGGIIAAVMAGKASRKPLECKGVAIEVLDSLENDFVTVKDIKAFLDREYGKYIGTPLDSLKLSRIEQIIDNRSAVHKSEAYVTRDGMLHITVTQRKPVARFQKADGGFYADIDGFVFPLQSSYASHVQIIDGEIPVNMKSGHKGMIEDPKEKAWFDKIMGVVRYIENSRTWKERIVQIHVDNGGELTLVPREGNERFRFGQPVNIDDKFKRIEKYYTAIAPVKQEAGYRNVSVEYDGQIVCRK